MNRDKLQRIVSDVLHQERFEDRLTMVAEAVLDVVLPQITKAEQLQDIPDRSIIVVSVTGGGQPMEWRNGYLLDTLLNDEPQDPEWLITNYGPLTVVWQP